jgi:hypothetical protein
MPEQAWQQAHVDIGALAQRVTGLENGLQEIRSAIGDLAKKFDAKPTNWWGVIAGMAALLTVIGGAIGMLMSPVNGTLDRHEREIGHIVESAVNRADYMRDRDETERWLNSLRDRQRFNEDRGVFKTDLDRLEKLVTKLTDSTATKSDLSEDERRTDDRINTIAGALHELQHDFSTSRAAATPK